MCDGQVGVNAVADPGALGLELVSMVDEELQIVGVAVDLERREALLTRDDSSDRDRVRGVGLAARPQRLRLPGRQAGRHEHRSTPGVGEVSCSGVTDSSGRPQARDGQAHDRSPS